MTDPIDIRFFQALREVCSQSESVDHNCRDALNSAVETPDLQNMQAARRAVDALHTPLRDEVMRQVHLRMATDLSAIWDSIPGAPGKQRAH